MTKLFGVCETLGFVEYRAAADLCVVLGFLNENRRGDSTAVEIVSEMNFGE